MLAGKALMVSGLFTDLMLEEIQESLVVSHHFPYLASSAAVRPHLPVRERATMRSTSDRTISCAVAAPTLQG